MKNKVHVQSFYNSLHKYKEELCGDKVAIRMNDDSFTMVLADGLGSGVKANILSTLTSTIISEMIKENLTIEEVVETMSTTLPKCSERHIAYSTFTILQVFFDGTAKLVEYDNPPSILLRNKKSVELNKTTRIVGDKEIRESMFTVYPDDIIVFFSDGIIHASAGEVLDLKWDYPQIVEFLSGVYRESDSAQLVNYLLLNQVNGRYEGKPMDDCTVAVAKILKETESVIVVGPPLRKEDDLVVVNKLLSATGKKICCGGTTSQIVSRVMKRKLKIASIDANSNVPPIGYINGIDLVTEGVVTLSKVSEYLKQCIESTSRMIELLENDSKDGATIMLKILLNECTKIVLVVGQSENRANHNTNYSTSFIQSKLHLIETISERLRALGKIVVIEHY